MEEFKTKFQQKISDLSMNKASNSTLIMRENYDKILARLCDLNSNKEINKSSSDWHLLYHFVIREFDVGGQKMPRLAKAGTNLLFVCYEVLGV
jgi:hypothetical protein